MSQPVVLDEAALGRAVSELIGRDARLSPIVQTWGTPPLWAREPGFSTLLRIILEQQVSLASARAAYTRLESAIGPVTPEAFLQLDDARLKAIGFSRQKTAYGRGLAEAILAGRVDLTRLAEAEDDVAFEQLKRIKGVGAWTAHIYLLMALLRPDVWPAGDRALAVATQGVLGLLACPSPAELETIGVAWQPWRAVAARLLWHYYLNRSRS